MLARTPQEFKQTSTSNTSVPQIICLPETGNLDLTIVFTKIVFLVCIFVLLLLVAGHEIQDYTFGRWWEFSALTSALTLQSKQQQRSKKG